MNGIQRVLNAINRVPGSRVPKGELVIDREFLWDYFKWFGKETASKKNHENEHLIEFCHLLKLDLVCIQPLTDESPSASTIAPQISSLANSGLFVFWVVNGAFQSVMNRYDMLAFFKLAATKPEALVKEMEQASKQILNVMDAGIAGGAHGILIADDIAYQKSTYMPPAFYETHLFPLWRGQVVRARKLGVPVFFHSDGNINKILPTIIDAGFNGLQGIEPAAGMKITDIKKNTKDKLCLMGNIDPSLLMAQSGGNDFDEPLDALHLAIDHLMAEVAPGGGFIFGTCSGLFKGMSPEKVHHMYRVILRDKGKIIN